MAESTYRHLSAVYVYIIYSGENTGAIIYIMPKRFANVDERLHDEVRDLYASGKFTKTDLAKEYETSPYTISKILNNKSKEDDYIVIDNTNLKGEIDDIKELLKLQLELGKQKEQQKESEPKPKQVVEEVPEELSESSESDEPAPPPKPLKKHKKKKKPKKPVEEIEESDESEVETAPIKPPAPVPVKTFSPLKF